MKKTILSILGVITLILSMCFVLNACKLKKKDYVLSLRNINNYTIGDSERKISQVLYFSRDNIYNNMDIVNQISIVDNDSRLNLKINNIRKTGYTHKYKNEKYSSYIYDLSIPSISGDMYFLNAKLEIISEEHILLVPIGVVEIRYDKDANKVKDLNINSLSGKCLYDPYQSLATISMNLENKINNNITIKKMTMGKMVDLFIGENNTLTFNNELNDIDKTVIGYMEIELNLSLSYKARYILKESFIEIIYNDGSSDKSLFIDTYNFYDNGFKIPESTDLVMVDNFKV